MKIAVIDDMEQEIRNVKSHLARVGEEDDVFGFSSVAEYEAFVEKNRTAFDVLFLDIMLREQNGIEIGEQLVNRNNGMLLVFISADPSFFRDVYKVRHTYFLTKPIDSYYFDDCMRRIRAQLSSRKLILDTGGEKQVVELYNVLYIESQLRKTIFHFHNAPSLCVNRNMREIEQAISSDAFVRVHKSFIVNLDYVSGIERSCVIFPDGLRVNVSRPYIRSFREKTVKYFNGVL